MTTHLEILSRQAEQGDWFIRDDMVISMHENIADGVTRSNASLIAYLANHRQDFIDLIRAAAGVFDEHGDATEENNAWENLREALKPLTQETAP